MYVSPFDPDRFSHAQKVSLPSDGGPPDLQSALVTLRLSEEPAVMQPPTIPVMAGHLARSIMEHERARVEDTELPEDRMDPPALYRDDPHVMQLLNSARDIEQRFPELWPEILGLALEAVEAETDDVISLFDADRENPPLAERGLDLRTMGVYESLHETLQDHYLETRYQGILNPGTLHAPINAPWTPPSPGTWRGDLPIRPENAPAPAMQAAALQANFSASGPQPQPQPSFQPRSSVMDYHVVAIVKEDVAPAAYAVQPEPTALRGMVDRKESWAHLWGLDRHENRLESVREFNTPEAAQSYIEGLQSMQSAREALSRNDRVQIAGVDYEPEMRVDDNNILDYYRATGGMANTRMPTIEKWELERYAHTGLLTPELATHQIENASRRVVGGSFAGGNFTGGNFAPLQGAAGDSPYVLTPFEQSSLQHFAVEANTDARFPDYQEMEARYGKSRDFQNGPRNITMDNLPRVVFEYVQDHRFDRDALEPRPAMSAAAAGNAPSESADVSPAGGSPADEQRLAEEAREEQRFQRQVEAGAIPENMVWASWEARKQSLREDRGLFPETETVLPEMPPVPPTNRGVDATETASVGVAAGPVASESGSATLQAAALPAAARFSGQFQKIDLTGADRQTVPVNTLEQDGQFVRAFYDDRSAQVFQSQMAALDPQRTALDARLPVNLDGFRYVPMTQKDQYGVMDAQNNPLGVPPVHRHDLERFLQCGDATPELADSWRLHPDLQGDLLSTVLKDQRSGLYSFPSVVAAIEKLPKVEIPGQQPTAENEMTNFDDGSSAADAPQQGEQKNERVDGKQPTGPQGESQKQSTTDHQKAIDTAVNKALEERDAKNKAGQQQGGGRAGFSLFGGRSHTEVIQKTEASAAPASAVNDLSDAQMEKLMQKMDQVPISHQELDVLNNRLKKEGASPELVAQIQDISKRGEQDLKAGKLDQNNVRMLNHRLNETKQTTESLPDSEGKKRMQESLASLGKAIAEMLARLFGRSTASGPSM